MGGAPPIGAARIEPWQPAGLCAAPWHARTPAPTVDPTRASLRRQVDKVGRSAAVSIVRSLIRATAQRVEATAQRVAAKAKHSPNAPPAGDADGSTGGGSSSSWPDVSGFLRRLGLW